MGKRGPAPESAGLRVLKGDPGKRPLAKRQRPPSPTRVTCPEWLSTEAKAEWRRVAPELERRGLLTALDRAAFAVYCTAYAQWRECRQVLDEHGRTYLTPRGAVKERPEVETERKAAQLMRTFAVEFGLTPGSRTRMVLPGGLSEGECPSCTLPFGICGC